MKDIETQIANIVNATATGEAVPVETIGAREHQTAGALLFLNVTSLTGTAPTMDVTVVVTIDGVDFVVGTFTQAGGVTSEMISVAICPNLLKVKYTAGGTVTDFDATVTCVRL